MNKVNLVYFAKTQDDSNPISNSFQASFTTTFHQKMPKRMEEIWLPHPNNNYTTKQE